MNELLGNKKILLTVLIVALIVLIAVWLLKKTIKFAIILFAVATVVACITKYAPTALDFLQIDKNGSAVSVTLNGDVHTIDFGNLSAEFDIIKSFKDTSTGLFD